MGQWSAWYAHRKWRRLRTAQLQREPLCRHCLDEGRITPANEVDHIEPHKGDRLKFWVGPFRSLCKECHSRVTAQAEGKRVRPRIGTDGAPEGW